MRAPSIMSGNFLHDCHKERLSLSSLFLSVFLFSFPRGQKNWLKFRMTVQGEREGRSSKWLQSKNSEKKKEREKRGPRVRVVKKCLLSGNRVRDSEGGLWKWKEGEWKRQSERERTAVEGLRAKLELVWQYQSHRSSREKLLTGAHRTLIDCELCCGAQPITRAPRDFSGFEHLHAVCRPIRETTQGEESGRDREKGGKTKRWGGKVVLSEGGREWDFRIMVSLFNLSDLDFVYMDFSTLLCLWALSWVWSYWRCDVCIAK